MVTKFVFYIRILLFLSIYNSLINVTFAHNPKEEEFANKIFGKFSLPTKGESKSIGFYSKGCLSGAIKLEDTGPSWQIMRPSRNRNWGHPSVINYIKDISKSATEIGWKGLYIGDIGGPRGGPMPYGHQSHQTGLDVDIWLTPPKSLSLTRIERDKIKALSVRKKNLKEVNSNWTFNHAKILRAAAKDSRVDRIFINAPAKIWMCDNMKGSKKWLQKIRPIWGHNTHFHVRLKCPNDSAECIKQIPTVSQISKSSDGCDETLNWWVTTALEKPDPTKKKPKIKKRIGAREYKMKDLPSMCLDIIHMK